MKKVLVTGAAGFLGGWVVESFLLSGVPVRAGIRSWNSAIRLARRPAEVVPCDVLSPEQLRAALKGCDAVVHCAAGDDQVIVEGTRNVLSAAHEQNVRRIVHLSSIAVYGAATGRVEETRQKRSDGNRYGQAKIESERICDEFAARGAPVVMLRPSIIYGPFSEVWTVSFARRLWSGRWGTFGKSGEGKCNLVYVTDVVQAIHQALTADEVTGEAFNVNGGEIITWNDYFTRFNAALGREPLRALNTWRVSLRAKLLSPVRGAARYALARFGKSVSRIHARSALAARFMNATESSLKLTPTSDQLKRYRVDAEYVVDKARDKLGFDPQVDVAQGLAHSVAWLHHHGVLF